MNTSELRRHASENHVNEDRYEWLVGQVDTAINSFLSSGGSLNAHSPDCKINIFAQAMMNCCESGDEARFFCAAVESTLREEHKLDEKSASNIAKFIIQRSLQAHEAHEAREKSRPSGCLTIVGVIGILAICIYAAQFFIT